MSEAHETSGPDATGTAVVSSKQRWLLLGVLTGEIEGESDLTFRDATPREIEAELKRDHLPELEAAGYIEWDHETGEISKGPKFQEIEPVLRSMMDSGDVPRL